MNPQTPIGGSGASIKEFLDKLTHRHRWSKVDSGTLGCTMYSCAYCYKSTWTGDMGLVPLGTGSVYSNTRCDRSKSDDKKAWEMGL